MQNFVLESRYAPGSQTPAIAAARQGEANPSLSDLSGSPRTQSSEL